MLKIKFSEKTQHSILTTSKYFCDWDQSAAVRSKQHSYDLSPLNLKKQLVEKMWFIPSSIQILKHPVLQPLDRDQQQFIAGHVMLHFLETLAFFEHEYVNKIMVDMAFGSHSYNLPDILRRDALKVYTDEAYHSLVMLEATQAIREHLNLSQETAWPLVSPRIDGLQELIDTAPQGDAFLIKFGIAFVSETTAVKELLNASDRIVVDPIANLINDHAQDEMKHCLYFTTLFEVIWEQLTLEEKTKLGNYLPSIIKRFSRLNDAPIRKSLYELGFSKDVIQKVAQQTYTEDLWVKRAKNSSAPTFRILKRLEILDDLKFKQSFISEGFSLEEIVTI